MADLTTDFGAAQVLQPVNGSQSQGIFLALGYVPETVAHRRPRDYDPTPVWVTAVFLALESDAIRRHGSTIWEPVAGDGAMLGPMAATGFGVIATDIGAPANGVDLLDFLLAERALAPAIVTNPIYVLGGPRDGSALFVAHAVALGVGYLALLLPANWMWSLRRPTVLTGRMPSRIRPISPRIDWDDRGSPLQDYAWHVWDAGHSGPTIVKLPEGRR